MFNNFINVIYFYTFLFFCFLIQQLLQTCFSENILKNYRPVMNGEIYLSGEDVCKLLHISKRTLQQYRDDNILPFIQIGGKIIYKESDILKVLEQNYVTNDRQCL